jgi:zinc protease
MRWFAGVVSSIVIAASAAGCVGTRPTRLPSTVSLPLGRQKLANGVTVVTHRDDSSPVASAVLVIDTGASNDPTGREGLAHAVEHLAFRAEHEAKPSIRLRLHRMGAAFNAYTSSETTVYVATVPAANVGELVHAFADIAANPLAGVNAAMLDTERGVLDNERRLRNENGAPGEVVDRLRALVYGRTPRGKSIGGTAQSLRAITLDDALAFASAHYQPKAMTLAVSGPIGDGTTALLAPFSALAQAAVPPALPPTGAPPPGALDEAGIEHVPSSVTTPELWLGWSLPGAYGKDAATIEIIADMAAGALASGAWERHADVTSGYCFLDRGRDASMLACRATLSSSESLGAVKRSLVNVVRKGIADRASSSTTRYLYTRSMATAEVLDLEPLGWRTEQFARGAHFAKDPRFSLDLAASISATDSSAVMDLYDRVLTHESVRAVLAAPGNPETVARAPLTTPELELRGAAIPDSASLLDGIRPERVVEQVLTNGLRVLVASRKDARFQTALLGFFDGTSRQPPAVVDAARWSYRSYIVEPPRGVLQSLHWHADGTSRMVRGPAGDSSVLLSRLDEGLANYDFEWKNEPYLDFREGWKRRENDPREATPRNFRQKLYANHPYGAAVLSADVDAVTVSQLRDWYDAVHRPENAVLVFVGPGSAESLLRIAEDELGGWQRTAKREPPVPAQKPLSLAERTGPRLMVGDRPGETQVSFEVGCVLPVSSAASAAAEDVFASVLDEALDWDLRQRTGATYGVNFWLERLRGGTSVLHARSAVANEHLDPSLKTLREWFAGDADLVTEDAVKLGRFDALRQHVLDSETSADFAATLFAYARRGLSLRDLAEQPKRISSVTLADVQRLLAACRATSLFSAVGDERRIRGAWARP